jgi:DNA polymerase-1
MHPPRKTRIWFHNAKYDAPLVGVNLRDLHKWDDTMLLAYVLREGRVGLKELGPRLTGIQMDPISTILNGERYQAKTLKSGPDKGMVICTAHKYKRPFSVALQEDPEPTTEYALKDAVVTSRLAEVLSYELAQAENKALREYYRDVEKPIVPILRDMEDTGVLIGPDVLVKIGKQLRRTQNRIQRQWLWCNLKSNRDVARLLQVEGGYTLRDRTPTGEWKVDNATLLKLAGVDSREQVAAGTYIAEILNFREAGKLKGTYVDSLLERRDDLGRVHGRFNQAVTDTNRLSSSEPNLQNIPARTKLGKKIREAFIAPEGYTIIKADYSQLEVRIFAHYTQEPVLLQAYTPGQERDVHQGVADELGIARKSAKNVLFGSVYGADAPKLAVTAGVPLAESAAFLARLKQRIPSLGTWQQTIAGLLEQNGYLETLLGWRNYYPQFWSPIRSESRAALREGANMPIQGTAAGIVKRLMIALDGVWQHYGARLLMQVHDELVFECPDKWVSAFVKNLQAMGAAVGQDVGLTVALKLEIETGRSWGTTVPVHG